MLSFNPFAIPKRLMALGFFIGLLITVVEFTKMFAKPTCPPPQIQYRFVPRSFREEQENPSMPSEVFDGMFKNPTPWVK